MQGFLKSLLMVVLLVGFAATARADVCAICGKEIQGTAYIITDKVTGEKKLVCSDCIKLPRCYVCGLPVKDGGVELPDGRWLCARDAKTVVLDADDAERIFAGVEDDLDRLFSRFTVFPTNVDVAVIDRVDVDSMFDTVGNAFESPDLLGYTRPKTVDGKVRYDIRLLTGMPAAQLKETCAHELSHAWVGENVPKERHARLGRDAEEGFCEMIGYLLMDSQNEQTEKQRVLENHYTRGQVQLFIAAEQYYGFDQVLDWMKYGETAQLETGHLDEIRDVKMPTENSAATSPIIHNDINAYSPAPVPATLKLESILWANPPIAIINGRLFYANDELKVKIGETNVTILCLTIQTNSVYIRNENSGQEEKIFLSPD